MDFHFYSPFKSPDTCHNHTRAHICTASERLSCNALNGSSRMIQWLLSNLLHGIWLRSAFQKYSHTRQWKSFRAICFSIFQRDGVTEPKTFCWMPLFLLDRSCHPWMYKLGKHWNLLGFYFLKSKIQIHNHNLFTRWWRVSGVLTTALCLMIAFTVGWHNLATENQIKVFETCKQVFERRNASPSFHIFF